VTYLLLKLFHLVAVIMWIGPPLGAYLLLFKAHAEKDEARILWMERATERVLGIEHVAFVVMVGTGLAMIWASDGVLLAMPWLVKKLWVFGGIVLFEMYDIWLAHVVTARALASGAPLDGPEWARIKRLRLPLIAMSLVVGLGLIPAILYFAVAKQ
jgi:uncharacterized membrane protein